MPDAWNFAPSTSIDSVFAGVLTLGSGSSGGYYGRELEPETWAGGGDAWGVSGEGEVLVGPGKVAEPVRWNAHTARANWVMPEPSTDTS